MNPNFDEKNLKIFTLNCWGLQYVSAHKQQRIKLIAQHLVEHNYDIVFLQEIWCQSDFDYIRTTTKSKYRFAHMYKNASIIGTSGLVVLTVWTPKVIHFHPFSVNGSPFRPLHGDWFTTKGVGYVKIETDGLNLHLFCTHMHAQYDLNERINDKYSVHRICQSYEMAKFINLMTHSSSDSSTTRDLIVLAGDMNASSKELPYRLLVSLTELKDCYKRRAQVIRKIGDDIEIDDCLAEEQRINNISDSDVSDDDHITCGHRENTFTPQPINAKTNVRKRIDFILYKLIDKTKGRNGFAYENSEHRTDCFVNSICDVEHMKICGKCDDSGLSFSDHQPVVAQLKICNLAPNNASKHNFTNSELSSAEQTIILNEQNRIDGEKDTVITVNKNANFNKTHELKGDAYIGDNELRDNTDLGCCGDGSRNMMSKLNFIDDSDKFEEIGLLTGKHKLKSNILLEVTETASKVSKNGPLQLKQIASSAIKSKLEPKVLDKSNLLENTKCLLENYARDNQLTLTYCICVLVFAVIFLIIIIFTILMLVPMTTMEIIFLCLIITIITIFCAFLKFLTDRHELNAVNAIINDLKKEMIFNQ